MKCWSCGIEVDLPYSEKEQALLEADYAPIEEIEAVFEKRLRSNKRCYCESCSKKHDEEYQETLKQYWHYKNKIMLERAIKIYEKQNLDLYEYKEAFDAVESWIAENEKVSAFDSADEVAAAVVLIANEISIKIHPVIAKYEVDIAIPSMKAIVEIDGEMFHKGKESKESRRDAAIRSVLGQDWEVVRIPTKYIHQNIELLPECIKTIKIDRSMIRKKTGDSIPDSYSKHIG